MDNLKMHVFFRKGGFSIAMLVYGRVEPLKTKNNHQCWQGKTHIHYTPIQRLKLFVQGYCSGFTYKADMALGIKWPFITSNNHGKNAANLFLAKTASASKIANMTVLVGSFGWFCNMVKDVSIRGRVCEDMMAKNRLCIPGPFGEMWVVPCALRRVWRLHRFSPQSTTRNKTAGIPHHGNGTMAPWGFAGLAKKSMSSSNQALARFIWKPAMQMLQRCPFPKSSWAGGIAPCPPPLQVWRSEAVQEDMLSYSSTGMELTAGLGSGEVQWPREPPDAWGAITKTAVNTVSCLVVICQGSWISGATFLGLAIFYS